MNDEKIQTLHPQGKKGVNINAKKYYQIKETLLDIIQEYGEITYQQLSDLTEKRLEGKFEGKVVWYVVVVKLDLEARKIIERIPKTSPHEVRMTT